MPLTILERRVDERIAAQPARLAAEPSAISATSSQRMLGRVLVGALVVRSRSVSAAKRSGSRA